MRYISHSVSVVLVLLAASAVEAQRGGARGGGTVQVRGYTRKDGTYVAPHTRSAPSSGARLDTRTTARGVVPVIVAAPDRTESSWEGSPPSAPQARTTARTEPPKVTPVVEPEDPAERAEQAASKLLTLAKAMEENAKAEQKVKEASRMLDSARSRYADIVRKYPETAAAVEARAAIARLK